MGKRLKNYVQLINVQINVLLIKFRHSTRVNVRLSLLLILELSFYGCCHPCLLRKMHKVQIIILDWVLFVVQ